MPARLRRPATSEQGRVAGLAQVPALPRLGRRAARRFAVELFNATPDAAEPRACSLLPSAANRRPPGPAGGLAGGQRIPLLRRTWPQVGLRLARLRRGAGRRLLATESERARSAGT